MGETADHHLNAEGAAKRTQLGLRVTTWSSDLGGYGGVCDRPADHPQNGAVRATQPCEVIAGRRAWKLRPNRVTVAPQAWGKIEARAHYDRGVPSYEPASGERCSTPRPAHAAGRRLSLRGDHRESRAQSFGLTPGRLFGEQGSILCSRSRIRGTGTLQVSRHETLGKPETASIISRTGERMEGPRRCNRPFAPKLLTAM